MVGGGDGCGGRGCSILLVMNSLRDVEHPLVASGLKMGMEFFVEFFFDDFVVAFGAGFEVVVFGGVSFAASKADFLADEVFTGVAGVRVGRKCLARWCGGFEFFVGADGMFCRGFECEAFHRGIVVVGKVNSVVGLPGCAVLFAFEGSGGRG